MSTPAELSPNWQSITVRGPKEGGQWTVPLTNAPAGGSWEARLNERVVVEKDGRVYRPGVYAQGTLVEGRFVVDLPQTDDPDILPQGASFTITVAFDAASGGGSEIYDARTNAAYEVDGLDLIDIPPRSNANPSAVQVGKWLGVPNGAAQLGPDGRLPLSQLPTDIPTGGGGTGSVGPPGPAGPAGPQGERGLPGPQGIQGATGPTGRGYTSRGAWADKTTYSFDDTVLSFGSTFRVTTTHTSALPAPTAETPGQNYELVAKAGDPGGLGPVGPQGASGAAGPAGPAGPQGAAVVFEVYDYDDPDLSTKIAVLPLGVLYGVRGPVETGSSGAASYSTVTTYDAATY